MATWYVNSAIVGGTQTGSTWANAAPNFTVAISNSAAGDDFNVINTHVETSGLATIYTFKGSATAPNRVLCTSSISNAPAIASDLAIGAQITITGANGITLNGCSYINGLTFNNGSGTNSSSMIIAASNNSDITLENCTISVPGTLASQITFGNKTNATSRINLINTVCSFANSTSSIQTNGGNLVLWKNTPSAIIGTTPSTLITKTATGVGGLFIFDGVDLSALGSGKILIGSLGTAIVSQINNCKLGSGVTIASTPTVPGCYTDLINSDSTSSGYRQERYQFQGTLFTETINTLSGGATDGVQNISWKVIASSNNKFQSPFECFEVAQWNTVTGSSKTATVQIISNSTLTNADVFMECAYLGNASLPGASFISSAPATQLTANTNLTASGSTWNGNATTPQQISVVFTPQLQGIVRVKIKVAKPSLTVWIDPKVTIT